MQPTEPRSRLRVASDQLLRDLDVLSALEDEKRRVPPAEARFAELAARIEELAARIVEETARQSMLGDKLATEAGPGAPPISDVRRPVNEILEDWRAVERQRAESTPGSVKELEADALVDRLRNEFHEASRSSREQPRHPGGGSGGFCADRGIGG